MTGLYLSQIEGLNRAWVRAQEKGIGDVPSMVHEAWLRWLQLHGQCATVVVPMDGSLVREFPRQLLGHDSELLDRVAGTIAIGQSIPSDSPIPVPTEFGLPATLFAETFGIRNLVAQVGDLAGIQWELEPNPALHQQRADGSSSAVLAVDQLLADFAATLQHNPISGDYADDC